MRRIEHSYQEQNRWNDGVGIDNLSRIAANPAEFVVDRRSLDRRKADMLASLGELSGSHILDFGSGRGEISVVLAQRGAIVTGVEIGPDLVALAEKIAEVNQVSCQFVVGSIHELPFEDASFDHVVGGAILHHLPRQGVKEALAEAHRVLRPGGKAVFVECLENSRWFDAVQNLVPVGQPGDRMYRPSSLNRAAWREFLETADDRNLTNVELEEAGAIFSSVSFRYYGMLGRLKRLVSHNWFASMTDVIDEVLCHRASPIKKYSQSALITFQK